MTGVLVPLAAAYFIGAIPFGYLVTRLVTGQDVRAQGSGNIGATNVIRVCGLKIGLLVLLLDALKGVAAVLLPVLMSAAQDWPDLPIYCGLVAVCGHNWTVFLRFKGGKGVATSTGVFATLAPIPFAIALAGFLVTLLVTRFVSLASMAGAALLLIALLVQRAAMPDSPPSLTLIIVAAILVAFVFVRHRANIGRLIKGTEHRMEWGKSRKPAV